MMAGGLGSGIAGLRAEFKARLDLAKRPRWFVTLLGSAGYLARASVLTIVGLFLVFAAVDSNSNESTGIAGALRVIQSQTYGTALIACTAAGFLAFGLFGTVASRIPADRNEVLMAAHLKPSAAAKRGSDAKQAGRAQAPALASPARG